ncbi:MAG TPA: LamG-like jellyroll fold domain-containing protein, partial [Anaerolineae bacterium]|nr:LamG-like jellyroll fold domain-containing protein [Anaerolineae bacterium]
MHASHRVATLVLMLAVVLSSVGLPVIAEPAPPYGSTNATVDPALVAPPQDTSSSLQTASQFLLTQAQPAAPQQPAAPAGFNNSLTIDLSGYVSVTHSSAIQPTVAATYEVWIRRSTTTAGCQAILGKDYTQAYWLGLCNNVIRFHSGGAGSAQDGTTAIPAGVWTHIAVVWDTVSNTRKYYINGDLEYTGAAGTAPTGTRELRIGYDGVNPGDEFAGNIAEVRIWNVARSQDDIRHTLNEAIQAPLPGLVADWHLSDDYNDSIGGFNGTPIGPISLSGPASPAQPIYVTIDKDFNTLPYGRYGAATVYLPDSNQALLIGGIINGAITNHIDTVDVATGKTKALGTLPSNRDFLSAAYDPDKNTVYVFGSSDTFNGSTFANTIYAIDFPTATVRTLAATLPTPAYGIGAVYDSQQKRIYLLGGYSGSVLNTVNVFDPQSETIGTTSVTLPQPDYQMAAIYSPLSDRIYTFGGLTTGGTAVNTINTLNFTSATAGSVTQLSAHLPQADFTQNAVQDAHTGLIYLIGGESTDQVLAFDPVTNDLWSTLIKLPQTRSYAGAVYSDRNRHALFIGGGAYLSNGDNFVYRIPLGNGPSVPIGRWDFPQAVASQVNSIAGEKNVYVGTNGSGFYRYYPNGTQFQIPGAWYGSASGVVNGMYYNPLNNLLWFGTNDKYFWSYDGSALVGYDNTNTTSAMQNPGYSIDGVFLGHGNGAAWQSFNGVWNNSLSSNVTSLASRAGDPAPFGEFTEWAAVGSPIIPKPNGPSTRGVNAPNNNYNFDYRLHRLTFNLFVGGSGTDANYGTPCGYATINDIRFDRNGDFFIPNGAGVCFIGNNPNYGNTLTGNEIFPLIGGQPVQATMDADGRIWVASLGNGGTPNNSGGLIAYEAVGNWPTITVTTSEFNWLNAPVGSRTYGNGNWLSRFNAVGAIDERVWAGRTDGQLVTLAQRWQQIDQSDNIGQQAIENIWMARGRAFLSQNSAVGGTLYVLMPDGKTWDNRSGVHVRSVLGDSQGRIWIGTDNDVRLYTSTGWITFTASLDQGTPPIGPVYALAEDQQGRIWIGSANGLTLFDRDRFVFTLNKANFGLPADAVHTLTVDRDNAVWAGTNSG